MQARRTSENELFLGWDGTSSSESRAPAAATGGAPPPADLAPAAEWHRQRARAMLARHPEIRALFGARPASAVPIAFVWSVHAAIAASLRHAAWWQGALLGWVVGAVFAHALGVAIHELAHDAVFRQRWANRAFAIFVNLPLGFPGAIDFRDKHLRHHQNLGDREGDTQAPSAREVALTGASPWRKMAWLTFGPLLFHGQASGGKLPPSHRAWLVVNIVACFALWPPVFLYSKASFLYLCVGGLMAFGLHPVGVRRYAEHLTVRAGQPTASYYGPWNRLTFGVGHHVEHHDFPSMSWANVPQLKRIAPEFYGPLATVPSWSRALLALFFRRDYPVDRYVVARFRGTEPVTFPRYRVALPAPAVQGPWSPLPSYVAAAEGPEGEGRPYPDRPSDDSLPSVGV